MMKMRSLFKLFSLFISLFFNIVCLYAQKQQGLALTPPMGWNSWNCFRENLTEEKVMAVADAMVSSGMKDAGYEYITIDDGWMWTKRDEGGHLVADPVRFPHGIQALSDYIHSLGLKFGIYSSPALYTCNKLVGSLGHEQIDANDFAAWGVDYLKYDYCYFCKTYNESGEASKEDGIKAYELMRDCIGKTGRKIVFSAAPHNFTCSGEGSDLPWVKDIAHLHRTGEDIKDNWKRMLYCLETTADLWEYAGPGFWNDPDMLEVGNITKERIWGKMDSTKMTILEYRSHFSMWCMVAAPLITGNDLSIMKDEIRDILTNKELIAIDQDVLGKQGRRILKDGDKEIWTKELSGNRWAVALFNRTDKTTSMTVFWKDIGLSGKYKVRDLWKHENLGKFKDSFTAESIQAHEAVVLLVE